MPPNVLMGPAVPERKAYTFRFPLNDGSVRAYSFRLNCERFDFAM